MQRYNARGFQSQARQIFENTESNQANGARYRAMREANARRVARAAGRRAK